MQADRLLWVLRDHFLLNGPKFGCGVGACGACAVHVDGQAERSCLVSAADVAGRKVTTLEGIGAGSPQALHPLQKAWIEHGVPQCGFCQNGQLMTALAVLNRDVAASDRDIADAMDSVICRCGTHSRIRAAIKAAQAEMRRRG
jgi:aerobic-type carbon monoxide dehydrogenase small subunit (CoxS/CutS family)